MIAEQPTRKVLKDLNKGGLAAQADSPEIDQVTQARRLSEVTTAARELIAMTLDVPMSKARVRVRVRACR